MKIQRILSLAALALIGAIALAQPTPPAPDRPDRPAPEHADRRRHPQDLTGTVQSYNLAPRGNYEGLLVKTGDRLAQINFPPDMAAAITHAAPLGEQVKMQVIPQMSMPDHPVYDLVSITGPKGQELKLPRPGEHKVLHADAPVKHLNYDRTGQVNGAILESGDFVFIGPDAANMDLKPGQKLTADGRGAPMADGKNIINAETVNGVTVHKPPMPREAAFSDGARDRAPRDGQPRPTLERLPRDGERANHADRADRGDRADNSDRPRPEGRGFDRRDVRDGGPRPAPRPGDADRDRDPNPRPPFDRSDQARP